jgi:hypothetical protein
VKANRVRILAQTSTVRLNLLQINEPARSLTTRGVPEAVRIISLGRQVVITDNESSQNSGFSGRIAIPEKADSRDDARR